MAYSIEFTNAAKRQFDKLPTSAKRRMAEVIDHLSDDPRPDGVVKLSGEEGIYRVRLGDYRIVYSIEDDRLRILILKTGHRREVYR